MSLRVCLPRIFPLEQDRLIHSLVFSNTLLGLFLLNLPKRKQNKNGKDEELSIYLDVSRYICV